MSKQAEIHFDRVAIVGVGLIGGSFALGLRSRLSAGRIIGCGRNPEHLKRAVELGVIDEAQTDVAAAARGCDLVMVAAPVGACAGIFAELAKVITQDMIVTDAGSTKLSVMADARAALGRMSRRFVPGHPIAGTENSGVEAAFATLYDGSRVILTPANDSDSDAVDRVRATWQALGADVVAMEAEHHDEVLAATSHLPHMLAYSLVDTLARMSERRELFEYAAGGFADFSRVASSSPEMWVDIARGNRDALLPVLDEYMKGLQHLRGDIASGRWVEVRQRFRASQAGARRLRGEGRSARSIVNMLNFIASPGQPLVGDIDVPGDKSISHRAVMFGALASGRSRITGFLEGADCLATMSVFRRMGVAITHESGRGILEIEGVGMNGLKAPAGMLDVGNSGTSMRLILGLLAGQAFDSELTGDSSLRRRPMDRVVAPLRQMGARIETAEGGRAPLGIRGGSSLTSLSYSMPVASAQVKSCLLLAGLHAHGTTQIIEPGPSRDHSERMFRSFGVELELTDGKVSMRGGQRLRAADIEVPADLSSATFFLTAASIVPGSDLLIRNVGVNPTRDGVLTILRQMGADISEENPRQAGEEPVADLRVLYADLKGIDIDPALVPLAIDEFPAIFIAAACAEGVTRLRGARELRVKESDRIAVMAEGLRALGVELQVHDDGMDIKGGSLGGGCVKSHGDHRIAMAFAVAAQRASGEVRIGDCENVNTSFPGFAELAKTIGMGLVSQRQETESDV